MYDSVTVDTVPAGAAAVAGYVGGHWPTYGPLARRFPHAHHLAIAVNAGENADCLDVEAGDARPDQAPDWVRRQLLRGVRKPVLYASVSQMPAVLQHLAAAGINRGEVRLWTAHYTFHPHLCTPACGYDVHADATQYTDRALGRNLDESLCADAFFPAPAPHPSKPAKPIPGKVVGHSSRYRPAAPHPKVIASTLGGSLAAVIVALVHGSGTHMDPQLAAAISTVAAAVTGYITPARK